MQAGPVISLSPSFSTFSNSRLAGIAARVVGEFDSDEFHDEFCFERGGENSAGQRADQRGGTSNNRNPEPGAADDDDDFDFAFATRDLGPSSQIPADEIFQNGKIRPVYPVLNRDVLLGVGHVGFRNDNEKGNDGNQNSGSERPKIRNPLRKLFIEERGTPTTTSSSSSSSSDVDEMGEAAAELSCVWRPIAVEDGGSNSKRWKFKDLLRRSHSYGSKNSTVVLSHNNSARKKGDGKKVNEMQTGVGKVNPAPPPPYNRDGGEKRRSYLPYRQDLVGVLGNVSILRKNLKLH
ncbi:hypothetical protein OROHE_008550 [Orobanche hederae]